MFKVLGIVPRLLDVIQVAVPHDPHPVGGDEEVGPADLGHPVLEVSGQTLIFTTFLFKTELFCFLNPRP